MWFYDIMLLIRILIVWFNDDVYVINLCELKILKYIVFCIYDNCNIIKICWYYNYLSGNLFLWDINCIFKSFYYLLFDWMMYCNINVYVFKKYIKEYFMWVCVFVSNDVNDCFFKGFKS